MWSTIKSGISSAWKWLVVSSTDSTRVALTVRGLIVGALPLVVYLAPHFGLTVDMGSWTAVADLVRQIIEWGLGLVATIMTGYGLVRKLILTFEGLRA